MNVLRLALCIVTGIVIGCVESSAIERDLIVRGRDQALVSTPVVLLSDIAEISSMRIGTEEGLVALKKIVVAQTPRVGAVLNLSADSILSSMKRAGVNLEVVAYTFPQSIRVERASRRLTEAELLGALQDYLDKSQREIKIRQILPGDEIRIVPGELELSVKALSSAGRGRADFALIASIAGEAPINFNVSATVDEWRQVPVAKRPLNKGSVVGSEDLMMARVNLAQIPRDALQDSQEVVGFACSSDLSFGEYFHRSKLTIPTVIPNGARVMMIYKSGPVEASAKGVALENGAIGQEVKVRNEASKKVVSGKVREAGLVEVTS